MTPPELSASDWTALLRGAALAVLFFAEARMTLACWRFLKRKISRRGRDE